MRGAIKALVLVSLLTGCGSEPVEDRRMVNERFMGTVVSVNRVNDVRWEGVGNRAMNGAGYVARAGVPSLGSAVDAGLGTRGLFTSMGTSLSGAVGGNSDTGVSDQYLNYVIETEEGQRLNVTATGRGIFYPGDEVMVVRNQRGYSEVFPRDLSGRSPGGR